MALLEINDLRATVDGKEILKGINLSLDSGQVHAIMGPNGSGKSTLSYVLSGRAGYEVTGGEVLLDGTHGDIAGDVGEELVGLRALLLLLLLALAVWRDIVTFDLWLASLGMLLRIPRVLVLVLIIVLLLLVLRLLLLLLLLSLLLSHPLLVLARLVLVPGALLGLGTARILLLLPGLLAKGRLVLLVLSLARPIGQAGRGTSHGAIRFSSTAHHEI